MKRMMSLVMIVVGLITPLTAGAINNVGKDIPWERVAKALVEKDYLLPLFDK